MVFSYARRIEQKEKQNEIINIFRSIRQSQNDPECDIYFGSYLIRDRLSAFRSMVRRMLSVSESLCTIVAFRWVRFDSSNARNASCVNGAVVGGAAACNTAAGNNCRTAEFGLSALWKSVDCFLTEAVSDTSPSSSAA